MNVVTKSGEEIDVSSWFEQMCENHRLDRNVLEQTPIGITAEGEYFLWDEEKNPALTKRSVNKLIRLCKATKQIEKFLVKIQKFLDSSERNTWITTSIGSMYIRKSKRYLHLDNKYIDAFDIATISLHHPGRGTFTEMLPRIHAMHSYDATYVENVLSDRFQAWFKRQPGWVPFPGYPDSFIKMKNHE